MSCMICRLPRFCLPKCRLPQCRLPKCRYFVYFEMSFTMLQFFILIFCCRCCVGLEGIKQDPTRKKIVNKTTTKQTRVEIFYKIMMNPLPRIFRKTSLDFQPVYSYLWSGSCKKRKRKREVSFFSDFFFWDFFLLKSSKSFLPFEDAFLNAVRAITAFGG